MNWPAIADIAASVRAGTRSARSITAEALARIEAHDGPVRAVTRLLSDRALAEADAIDAKVAAGEDPGPLAGVPFGVKDLFDLAGLSTTAGAAMRIDAAPAARDAEAVSRLKWAGAVCVSTLNMDEYAYGFATINARFGTTANPHDRERLAGGSSGGSAAVVAAGMLPFALGSDTNGSIRVPASLCGLYGLKPTHGSLPMAGVFPFVDSFDDIGPFTTSVADLRLIDSVLRGDLADTATATPITAARLGGWFARNLSPDMAQVLDEFAAALDLPTVELPDVDRARSAAYVMTAAEGGARHLPELRTRALAFDPGTRDRLIAGAMVPSWAYLRALDFRAWFAAEAERLFDRHEILIAPAAPCVAPRIDQPVVELEGQPAPARAHLGLFTQPLSFIGLPVIAAPLYRPGQLPLGVQIIGRPGSEARLYAYAATLEAQGMIGVSLPAMEPA